MKVILVANDDVKIPVDGHWNTIKKGENLVAEITGGLVCIKFDVGDDEWEYNIFKKSEVEKYFMIER